MADEYQMLTVSGYDYGEVMSALQKAIRRGQEKEALYWALELNDQYYYALWRRLVVIVCEDIGMANPDLVATICSLAVQVKEIIVANKQRGGGYDAAILGFAILQMCRSKKSREADDYVNHVIRERRLGVLNLSIPPEALDKHTKRGKAMGKTVVDFWKEGPEGGCYLENELDYEHVYQGWDPDTGDASHDATGKNVSQKVPNPKHGRDVQPRQTSLLGGEEVEESEY